MALELVAYLVSKLLVWLPMQEDPRGSLSRLNEVGRDTRKCLLGYRVLNQTLYYSDYCWNTGLFNNTFNKKITLTATYDVSILFLQLGFRAYNAYKFLASSHLTLTSYYMSWSCV